MATKPEGSRFRNAHVYFETRTFCTNEIGRDVCSFSWRMFPWFTQKPQKPQKQKQKRDFWNLIRSGVKSVFTKRESPGLRFKSRLTSQSWGEQPSGRGGVKPSTVLQPITGSQHDVYSISHNPTCFCFFKCHFVKILFMNQINSMWCGSSRNRTQDHYAMEPHGTETRFTWGWPRTNRK